jgi:hypothetical protein
LLPAERNSRIARNCMTSWRSDASAFVEAAGIEEEAW